MQLTGLAKLALFFSWWKRQLYTFVPESWRNGLSQHHASLYVYMDDSAHRLVLQGDAGDTEIDNEQQLAELDRAATPVVVNIERTMLLVKTFQMPAATEENLQQVLEFEMDRQTPFTADQVYFAYQSARKNSTSQLDITLYLIPKSRVQQALPLVDTWGLQAMTTRVVDETHPLQIKMLPASYNHASIQRAKWLPVTISAMLLILLFVVPIFYLQHQLDGLQQQLHSIQTTSSDAQKIQQDLDNHLNRLDFLRKKYQASPRVLVLLNEISQLVPDSSWITRLEVRRDTIYLQGTSAKAAGLIEVLENSPYFSNARFESPVTNDRSGQFETFKLALDIVPQGDAS